ncbi:putative positive regulatior of mesenchymal stem cell differentiation [Lyophyllum shimeji]|uniref:Positive regulatior of mesenchymal stem cell differentiation n=1 Tax=Lyophyllum shimeji TaxID=47721 RepID=A0A9P3UJU3_LYOSH|nr:putative positive regulatior of mesenchymal stem cell differentiation [Lyophyllum shimeji]
MESNLKEEERDSSPRSRLYMMPPSPPAPLSTPEDSTFGDWTFTKAAGTFDASLSFHTFSSCAGGNGQDDSQQSSVLYPQPESSLSGKFLLDQPFEYSHDSTSTSSSQKSQRAHVPRPPNAFMLYRSDFLKRGIIPSHVERRQQNLSRIAGQCWNLLPPEEKAQWQDKAAQVLIEHRKCNPDYKFTPAPRGSRRPKAKGRLDAEPNALEGEERIRQIREEYARITGPTASPARRRRPRVKNRSRDLDKEPPEQSPGSQAEETQLPASVPTSPFPSLSPPGHEHKSESPLPPFFPQYSFPHMVPPRRPSTSLGFTTNTPQEKARALTGHNLTRPSSAASETGLTNYLKDLDITPTTATFGHVRPPSSPVSPAQTSQPTPEINIPFPTLNVSYPAISSVEQDSTSSHHFPDSFLGSLYSAEPCTFDIPPLPAPQDYSFTGDSYLFSNFDLSALHEGWHLHTSLPDVTKSYTL